MLKGPLTKVGAFLRSKYFKFFYTFIFIFALGMTPAYGAAGVLTFTASTGIPLFNGAVINAPQYAASSTGQYAIAAVPGAYRSTNYGSSWTAISGLSGLTISSVWSSADGTKLLATAYGGQIYRSTDSGSNWTALATNRNWNSISGSDDGTKIFAAVSPGYIYTSIDSGATWTERTLTNTSTTLSKNWATISSDTAGTRISAVADQFYYSTDSGATWTLNSATFGSCCFELAASSNEKNIIIGANGNGFYLSTDYGVTFVRQTAITTTSRDAPNVWGYGLGMSRDGSQIIALSLGDYLWISNDTGTTWTKQTSAGTDAWAGLATITNDDKIIVGSADYSWWTFTAKTYWSAVLGGNSTISLSTSGTSKKRSSMTITATLSNPGSVTFYENGRVILGCNAVTTLTTTATCNWKPQIQGPRAISAKVVPTDTNYTTSLSSVAILTINKRIVSR